MENTRASHPKRNKPEFMNGLIMLILSVFILCSCNRLPKSNEIVQEVSLEMKAPSAPIMENEMVGGNNEEFRLKSKDTSKKIIKTGEISFEVKDIQSTRAAIMNSVEELDGYVASEKELGYEKERKEYQLDLRVPAKRFDALLQAISSTASQ